MNGSIVIGNGLFRLTVGEDGLARSLILTESGEECLAQGEEIALFSVTQERPFNNEVKLAHPNKRTTFPANSLRREGDLLHVGFETVPVKAVIRLRETEAYVSFRLEGFTVLPEDYGGLCMDLPPVFELRLCQLPVRPRRHFGEWLNVVWDGQAAVCVLAASPAERIDSEKRSRLRLLTADAVRSLRLTGAEAGLIACPTERFMDCVDAFERDQQLPRGVQSRRNGLINASVYWASDLWPENLEEHIAWAKKGGFRLMLCYYTSFFKEERGYSLCGNYDFNEHYPNGLSDVERVLARLKQEGITPGLHFLQTHIGLASRYVTPHADHRLGKKQRFTLSRPLADGEDELWVEENPAGSPLHEKCRLLQFGGELIGYEGYIASERPFRFTGVTRGALGTQREAHPAGQVGGVLDVSEYGASSCYIDQNSSLQDEIAEKLAQIYNAGFGFCYMDGSEGTNAPYEYHVPNAQQRVYRRLNPPPLFTEGAAKAHFSWHFQAGGNAFDIFPPEQFKAMIARFPAEEAPRMRQDFTRLDFGWWGFWAPEEDRDGTQADQYEYGTSRAAAWDCPATIQAHLQKFRDHPRAGDILEVMRRWEDVRRRGLLTPSQKEALRDLSREHTLLIDETGGYELCEWREMPAPPEVSAYLIERGGERLAVCWHRRGFGTLELPLPAQAFTVTRGLGGAPLPVEACGGSSRFPVGDKLYLTTALEADTVRAAFAAARLTENE